MSRHSPARFYHHDGAGGLLGVSGGLMMWRHERFCRPGCWAVCHLEGGGEIADFLGWSSFPLMVSAVVDDFGNLVRVPQ